VALHEEELRALKHEEASRASILKDLSSQRDRVALSIAQKLAKVCKAERSSAWSLTREVWCVTSVAYRCLVLSSPARDHAAKAGQLKLKDRKENRWECREEEATFKGSHLMFLKIPDLLST